MSSEPARRARPALALLSACAKLVRRSPGPRRGRVLYVQVQVLGTSILGTLGLGIAIYYNI